MRPSFPPADDAEGRPTQAVAGSATDDVCPFHPFPSPEKARLTAIGRQLRSVYGVPVQEPLPEPFAAILARLAQRDLCSE